MKPGNFLIRRVTTNISKQIPHWEASLSLSSEKRGFETSHIYLTYELAVILKNAVLSLTVHM
jgi:hypothetical protein